MPRERTIVLKFDGDLPHGPLVLFPAGENRPAGVIEVDLFGATLVEIDSESVHVAGSSAGEWAGVARTGFTDVSGWMVGLGGSTREATGTILGAESWAAPELRIHDGDGGPPLRHALSDREGAQLVLGRSSDADVAVDDGAVSRRHCRFFVRQGRFFVEDLGSRHGTRIGGERIEGPHLLENGLRVCIGSTEVEFVSYVDKLRKIASVRHAGGNGARASRSSASGAPRPWASWKAPTAGLRRTVAAAAAAVRSIRCPRVDLVIAALFIFLVAAALVLLGRGVLTTP